MYPAELTPLEKKCDFAAIRSFAVLSDDYNPIHIDREFAAQTEMGGIIAHGPMSLGLMWQMLYGSLGPEAMEGLSLNVRLRRPVREDDVIRAGGKLREPGGNCYEVWIYNQKDEIVITGEVELATAAR
jgi:3-hydroxybutyryl-CoA dehydratase